MNQEVWRTTAGFPYEVSNLGRVRREETRRIIAQTPVQARNGIYLKVDLWRSGKRKTLKVHRLVVIAFLPRIPGKKEVNHLDLDNFNNRADNLEWCTRVENEQHKHFMEYSLEPELEAECI